ncbi:MAG: hypothetical protein Q9201_006731 [Fulgogasparrea decipioides]
MADNFHWAHCDAVRVFIQFDSEPRPLYLDIDRKEAFGGRLNRRSVTFSYRTMRDDATGQWLKAYYSFGELGVKEASDSKVSLLQITRLGQIRIWYQRITYGPEVDRPVSAYGDPGRISEVSEKMLKGQSIENTIKPTNVVKSTPPPLTCIRGLPLPGHLGQEAVIVVLYRSRKALQMLGCIPRSPSPAPLIRQEEQRISGIHDPAVKEEMKNLRVSLQTQIYR